MKLYVPVDDCDVATCGSDTSSRRDELGCQRRQRRRVFLSLPAELVADAAITTSDDNCLALKVDCLIEGPNDKGSKYGVRELQDTRRSMGVLCEYFT